MTIRRYANNSYSFLSANINNSQTSITVVNGSTIGAALSGSDYIAMAIDDRTNFEIVHVTAVSSNTLTIVRAQQGTSAHAFNTGTIIECRPTATSFTKPDMDLVEVRILGSAQAQVDFTGLSGTYLIVIDNLLVTASSAEIRMRMGYGGTPTYDTGNNYSRAVSRISSAASSTTINNGTAAAYIKISGNENVFASQPAYGHIKVTETTNVAYNTVSGVLTYVYTSPSTNIERADFGGAWIDNTNAITAIRIYPDTGNFDVGSKFYLYKRPTE